MSTTALDVSALTSPFGASDSTSPIDNSSGAGFTDFSYDPFLTDAASSASPSTVTAADTSLGGGSFSGLSDIFGAIGTSVTQIYRAVNPPSSPQQLVWNPQTGTYQQAGSMTPRGIVPVQPNLLVLGALALVALLIVAKK